MNKHILSVLVHNQYGVVTRVSALFTRRGFNIDSFTGEETEDPAISRLTIVVNGDEQEIDQVKKQVSKLVDVIRVVQIQRDNAVVRELALIKVKVDEGSRLEVMQIANVFRANIVDMDTHAMVVEITGTKDKIKALEKMLTPYGIVESVRTGIVALQRGNHGIND